MRRLASLAADVVAQQLLRPDVEALTFVPPDRSRRLERGHHPAERLARELGRRWELPVVAALRRSGTAPRQRGLDVASRRRNVRGAFTAVAAAPRRVCVVDDVYTSGATVSAAASALRAAGARRVDVVTFARTLRLR